MRPFWVEMGCHLKREILSKEFAVEKQLSNYSYFENVYLILILPVVANLSV